MGIAYRLPFCIMIWLSVSDISIVSPALSSRASTISLGMLILRLPPVAKIFRLNWIGMVQSSVHIQYTYILVAPISTLRVLIALNPLYLSGWDVKIRVSNIEERSELWIKDGAYGAGN